jgi:hypothetical protein
MIKEFFIQMFLLFMGVGCAILAIGYLNMILAGASVLALFFAAGSIIKRNTKNKE